MKYNKGDVVVVSDGWFRCAVSCGTDRVFVNHGEQLRVLSSVIEGGESYVMCDAPRSQEFGNGTGIRRHHRVVVSESELEKSANEFARITDERRKFSIICAELEHARHGA